MQAHSDSESESDPDSDADSDFSSVAFDDFAAWAVARDLRFGDFGEGEGEGTRGGAAAMEMA